MTTEELEKAAEEYAKSLKSIAFENLSGEETPYLLRGAFKEGLESANKHWQEKTRWIPIAEKLPPRNTETRQVFVKNIRTYKLNWTIISCFDDFYLDDVEFITRNFTHWKEIE